MSAIVEFFQQNGALFVALGGIATVLSLAFTFYKASHDKQVRTFEGQIRTLKDELTRNGGEHDRQVRGLEGQINNLEDELARNLRVYRTEMADLKMNIEVLKEQRDSAQAEIAVCKQRLEGVGQRADDLEKQLEERVERHENDVEAFEEQNCKLGGERDRESERSRQAEAGAAQLASQLQQLNEQIEQVINQEGRVWERPVTGLLFQRLSTRKVPIISILNLKGGVGKTTITANLAGLMAKQGKKVLTIDADYQRNLSMLLVSDKDRRLLHLERRTLQHFLKGPKCSLPSLLFAASEVVGRPDCLVVTNSDAALSARHVAAPALEDIGLEDVEIRLMAEWMFRQTASDVRLRLREALHDLALKEKGFQYVLIDCPPRLSTACINALAASDFFLIPVLLDGTSGRSVLHLLRNLCRLRASPIFSHLMCLGIVANNVTLLRGQPIAQEATTWQELPVGCKEAWGSGVPLFRTMVPHSSRIGKAAGSIYGQDEGPCLALKDTAINQAFTDLLQEIETGVQHESKQLATVSV